MTYNKQTWQDGEAGGTPITAARLNHIEDGLAAAAVLEGRPVNLHEKGVTPANSAATNTAAFRAAVVEAEPGARLFLPVSADPISINSGILIDKNLTVAGLGGLTPIQQTVWGKPVFDIPNRDTIVTIENFALTNTSARNATAIAGSVRDGGAKTYATGVWNAAHRLTVRRLSVDGFTSAVRITNWDNVAGAAGADTDLVSGCTVEDILVNNCDWGLVGSGLTRLYFNNIRGTYSLSPNSTDPAHLVYLSDQKPNRDIAGGVCHAYNGTGGHAYQFKAVDGLSFAMLSARNCPGILSLRNTVDVEGTFRSRNDLNDPAGIGSLYIQGGGTEQDIRLKGSFQMAAGAADMRIARIDGTDGVYELDALYANAVQSDDFMFYVAGTRNQLIRPRLRNTGSLAWRAIGLQDGTGHVVDQPTARDVRYAVTVPAGVTGCVINYDPVRSNRHSVSGGALIPTPDSTTVVRPSYARTVYTVGTANTGTSIRPDETTHAYLNVTGTSAFSISAPTPSPWVGATVDVEFVNNSGAAMGAVTWNATWDLSTTWAGPAAGKSRTITFRYDGSKFREVSRTA